MLCVWVTKTVLPENPIMLRPQSPRGLICVPDTCFGVLEWEKLQTKILLMKSDDKVMNVFYEVQPFGAGIFFKFSTPCM
jgi:hypothetical protein